MNVYWGDLVVTFGRQASLGYRGLFKVDEVEHDSQRDKPKVSALPLEEPGYWRKKRVFLGTNWGLPTPAMIDGATRALIEHADRADRTRTAIRFKGDVS